MQDPRPLNGRSRPRFELCITIIPIPTLMVLVGYIGTTPDFIGNCGVVVLVPMVYRLSMTCTMQVDLSYNYTVNVPSCTLFGVDMHIYVPLAAFGGGRYVGGRTELTDFGFLRRQFPLSITQISHIYHSYLPFPIQVNFPCCSGIFTVHTVSF